MARYTGQATVELPDGSAVDVLVALRSVKRDGLTEWSGSIEVASDSARAHLVDMTRGTIRTVTGAEPATFVVAGGGPANGGHPVTRFDIVGDGSAPPF